MRKTCLLIIAFILFNTIIFSVSAAQISYNPTTEFFVNDFANVLSTETKQKIIEIGKTIETKTTAQVIVVTVPNMNGDYIESYANKLFNKWGIGTKTGNNGILILVSKEERKVRIEVGYGLEGVINDAKAGRILDNYAISSLKKNDYNKGIIDILTQVQGEIYIEYGIDNKIENPKYIPENNKEQIRISLIAIAIFIFLIIITKGKILIYLFWIMSIGSGKGGSSGGGSFGGRRVFRWRWRVERILI